MTRSPFADSMPGASRPLTRPPAQPIAFSIALLLGLGAASPAIVRAEVVHSDSLVAVSKDLSLRVIEVGPREAQAIVFIPGWCFTAEVWSKQIAALSDRYRVIAFDPRSQGSSTILDHGNSPDDRAADVAALIKALGLRKPILVGWSQGVQDVAAYALAFGTGDVAGLVLVDSAVSAGAAGLDAKGAAMTLGRLPLYVESPRDYLEGMMSYVFEKPLSPAELDALVTAALRTPSSVGVANLTLDFFGKDYRKAFDRIDVPTLLVIAGTAADKAEQARQPIPHATSAIVDGAGHAVFHDEPARFDDLLAGFIEQRVKGAADSRNHGGARP